MSKANEFDHIILEKLKKINENGTEFWSARELQTSLGYVSWKSFRHVIENAKQACLISGLFVEDHFTWIFTNHSYSKRKTTDFYLSRLACYLIIQNGDPKKEAIALAQTQIALQTRKREIVDGLGSAELAAKLFWATQTEEKIQRENIKGNQAIHEVQLATAERVRETIIELGNPIPQNFLTN